jgi:glycine oxidase
LHLTLHSIPTSAEGILENNNLSNVIVIGAGIVGATIAYELSAHCQVTLIDRARSPASGSTGAALGLLMGIISQKTKGQAWQRREQGIRYYQQLLPQLAEIAGLPVAYNAQGLLKLIDNPDDRQKWQTLAEIRHSQGWSLEIWEPEKIQERGDRLSAAAFAVYSPADWQVHPPQLTKALVAASAKRGVECLWDRCVLTVTAIHPHQVVTDHETLSADWIIIAAGLGSTALAAHPKIQLAPVLGQAIRYQLPSSLDTLTSQPVLTRNDIHFVPLSGRECWVGATVEFPVNQEVQADPQQLNELRQRAIEYFPDLALAQEIESWSGLRPRPIDRPAPIIDQLDAGLLIATGHYRNGVLLAPATAMAVKATILG